MTTECLILNLSRWYLSRRYDCDDGCCRAARHHRGRDGVGLWVRSESMAGEDGGCLVVVVTVWQLTHSAAGGIGQRGSRGGGGDGSACKTLPCKYHNY